MNKAKKRFGVLALIVVVVAVACLALLAVNAASKEATAKDAAKIYLQKIGDEAAFVEKTVSEINGNTYYVFYSEHTNKEYQFDTDGNLWSVTNNLPQGTLSQASTLPALKDDELDKMVVEYFKESAKYGTLEIVSKNGSSGKYNYMLREVLDGIPTGTQISTSWLQDGTLVNAVVHQGSVFSDSPNGPVKSAETQISEAEAIEIATKAVEERIAGTDYAFGGRPATCSLDAIEDTLFYAVVIDTYSEKEDYVVTYTVSVNVTDGTILEVEYTQ